MYHVSSIVSPQATIWAVTQVPNVTGQAFVLWCLTRIIHVHTYVIHIDRYLCSIIGFDPFGGKAGSPAIVCNVSLKWQFNTQINPTTLVEWSLIVCPCTWSTVFCTDSSTPHLSQYIIRCSPPCNMLHA